jgi:hypothetical protein
VISNLQGGSFFGTVLNLTNYIIKVNRFCRPFLMIIRLFLALKFKDKMRQAVFLGKEGNDISGKSPGNSATIL